MRLRARNAKRKLIDLPAFIYAREFSLAPTGEVAILLQDFSSRFRIKADAKNKPFLTQRVLTNR